MKLGRFSDGTLALAIAAGGTTRALDVKAVGAGESAAIPPLTKMLGPSLGGSWRPLVDGWSQAREPLADLIERAQQGDFPDALRDLDEQTLGVPMPCDSTRIFALGGNFGKHIQDASRVALGIDDDETGALARRRAQGPWGFMILPETVVGPGAEIRPPGGIQKLDYEGEVGVILADGGRGQSAGELAVWGFTALNDFSLRDNAFQIGEPYDGGPMTWTLQKNWDTGTSFGPWIVVEEPFDVGNLEITLRVNGEVRQRGRTAEMIFTFGETFEHLSRFMTLRSCDLLASGTPAGTALEAGVDGPFLAEGDVTELEVEGVGLLRNSVSADAT